MRYGLAVLTWLAAALSFSSVEARSWTDAQGRKTEAEFVRVFNGNVVLQRGNQVLKIPFENFSADDQTFIRGELKRKGQEDLLPPIPAELPATAAGPHDASGDKAGSGEGAKSGTPAAGTSRIWTDSDGRKVLAQFESWNGDATASVTLRQGFSPLVVPFAKFSAADQDFLRKLVAGKQPPANSIAGGPAPRPTFPTNPAATDPRGRYSPPPFSPPTASARPPAITPPRSAAPAYTPPVYTPPTYTPPAYSPPTYTPPVYTPPAYTPPPAFQPPVQEMREEFHCSKCGYNFGTTSPALGSACPHCGVTFGFVKHSDGRVEQGDGLSAYELGNKIGKITGLVVVVIGVIAAVAYIARR